MLASTGKQEIQGLVNGTAYTLQAFALDDAGNKSAASATATGTPVETAGFFAAYRGAGGAETGGCGVAGGSASVAALALLGFWWSSRRMGSWVQR